MRIPLIISVCLLSALVRVNAEEEKGKPDEKHAEKGAVHLSPEAVKLADLELQPAAKGIIYTTRDVPGEIALNADRLAHLSSRATGNVVRILKTAGDNVSTGDVLAVIESAELGAAKIDYFTAKLNLTLAQSDLEREKLIHDNTQTLLAALNEELEPAELDRRVMNLDLGEIKTKALNCHAALRLAQTSFTRAEKLREDKVISGAALEVAAKELQNAKAECLGGREELKLNFKSRLLQSRRALSVAETAAQNARRRLHLLGLSSEQIGALENEKEENAGLLELRAPFAGTVLEKFIALGERAEEGKDAFIVADLSNVWMNIRVNTLDLKALSAGQAVQLTLPGEDVVRPAKIALLSPLIDEKTRTASARLVLENKDGALRPGAFATAALVLKEITVPVAVPAEAVQTIDGKTVVFIEGDAPASSVRNPCCWARWTAIARR